MSPADSPHIQFISVDDSMAQTLAQGPEAFCKRYGVDLGMQRSLITLVVTQTLALVNAQDTSVHWGGFLTIDQDKGMVVGTCAYKAAPNHRGDVEIALFTFPGQEGHGYAQAMAAMLADRALASGQVNRVVAHTPPVFNAATTVLKKSGFTKISVIEDPEDGPVWRWVKAAGLANP